MTDRQLLERFLQQNDSGAFEELVQAHGPMVLKVCHRILMNHHDAEEAFQATFLVLARKARSLLGRPSVAGWLHEVAQRTALNARRAQAQRQVREQQVEQMPDVIAETVEGWADVAPLLDQELSRLPEKYRLPVVLCDLEGKGLQEVAQQLGCPLGTLSSRLTRAREMLRIRLARHGVAVSTGALLIAMSQQAASANVAAALVSSTVQMVNVWVTSSAVTAGVISPHVAALTEGVLKTMFLSTLKNVIAAVALIAVAGLGAGGLMYQMSAAEQAGDSSKEVLKKLDGKWRVVSVETQGKVQRTDDAPIPREALMTFSGDKITFSEKFDDKRVTAEGAFKINAAKQPYEIDITDVKEIITKQKGMPDMMGIFEFSGDSLKIRYVEHTDGKDNNNQRVFRPTNLTNTNATDHPHDGLRTFERVKP